MDTFYVFSIHIFEKQFSSFIFAHMSQSGKAHDDDAKEAGNRAESHEQDKKSGSKSSCPDEFLRAVSDLDNGQRPRLRLAVTVTEPPGRFGVEFCRL